MNETDARRVPPGKYVMHVDPFTWATVIAAEQQHLERRLERMASAGLFEPRQSKLGAIIRRLRARRVATEPTPLSRRDTTDRAA